MKLSITNFRGISTAEIEPKKITIIAGMNGQGKTSIAQAFAAAATGKLISVDGIKKTESGMLVHAGTAAGEVILETPLGKSTVCYPSATRETTGMPLELSEYSSGLKSIVDEDDKTKTKTISTLMNCEPKREDLEAELNAEFPNSAPIVSQIWETIQVQGWDAAHSQAKEKGTKLKGRWEGITNDNFGIKKAATWMPASYTTDLENETEESLTGALKSETDWLEAAISSGAVNNDRIANLKAVAESFSVCDAERIALEKTLSELFDEEQLLKNQPRDLPSIIAQTTVSCPHCGGAVVVAGGKLKKQIIDVNNNLVLKRKQVADAIAAEMELKKTIAEVKDNNIEDCRERVERARTRLQSWQQYQQSQNIYKSILMSIKIVKTLAPDGLRMRLLSSAIENINGKLSLICNAANYKKVCIKNDLTITYNGTPYVLLSESEQYRCRIIFQAFFATNANDAYVIIDRADILDKRGRNGLFKLATEMANLKFFICMTMDAADKLPPPAALENIDGVAYWVEGGVCKKV